ncbi:glycosyltransferase [Hydrogenophaga sp.]|uniref:glycosyltransferase n=1 Tax=Hydrogenophaga sp. TaxID=1904254 RepID=UPI0035AE6B7E
MVRLARLGQALGPRFGFDAAVVSRAYEGELRALDPWVCSAPGLHYVPEHLARRQGPGRVLTATWGEYLGDLGFDRVERIRDVVGWWRRTLLERGTALLVADYAPLAQLAARSLGVACVVTSQGYGLPPAHLPTFPAVHPEASTRLHDEARLLDNVNQVARDIGLPPLAGLPEVHRADLSLVHTFGFLDPYRSRRRERCLPPVNDYSPVLASDGDEVFVYFSTEELDRPGVLEALERLRMPRRGVFLRATPEMRARLAASGMVVETAPVPVDLIVRRSRLLLHAGQHGMLSVGLLAGLPQVALPQNLEQLFHAQRAEAAGVARVVIAKEDVEQRLADAVSAMHGDASVRESAGRMATSLRADLDATPRELLAHAVLPLAERVLSGSR